MWMVIQPPVTGGKYAISSPSSMVVPGVAISWFTAVSTLGWVSAGSKEGLARISARVNWARSCTPSGISSFISARPSSSRIWAKNSTFIMIGFLRPLANVVDRERSNAGSSQRLHFDTGLPSQFAGGADQDLVVRDVRRQLHLHRSEHERMAQGDQVGGFLGGLDAGNAGHRQHVALFMAPFSDHDQGFRLHGYPGFGSGFALGDGFLGYIHHPGVALLVEVGQFCHVAPNSGVGCRIGDAISKPACFSWPAIVLYYSICRFHHTIHKNGKGRQIGRGGN